MTPLQVLIYPDNFLRKTAAEVTTFDDELKERVFHMAVTLYTSRGIGLASTQIGDGRRMFVMDTGENGNEPITREESSTETAQDEEAPENDQGEEAAEEPEITVEEATQQANQSKTLKYIINPVILKKSGNVSISEGCLSLPGLQQVVPRAANISVTYQTPDGEKITEEMGGISAICFQHELDHLDGKLITDYISPIKRRMVLKRFEKRLKQEKA